MGKAVGNEIGLDENFDVIAKVIGAHQKAIINYKIEPLNKEIFLFRAEKVTRYLNDFEYLGWKPYAKKVNVFRIDGEHDTIFNDPINKKLAIGLQSVLDDGAKALK
ncbi:MAG: hypothetical protein EOO92_13485 [Pedobacter sp.]|nr:MAG: hypothetical protein EOO92_13485 [Pedobacter sp.]